MKPSTWRMGPMRLALAQAVAEVLQVEALRLRSFFCAAPLLGVVRRCRAFSIRRQDVAHAQDALGHAVGWKTSSPSSFSPTPTN